MEQVAPATEIDPGGAGGGARVGPGVPGAEHDHAAAARVEKGVGEGRKRGPHVGAVVSVAGPEPARTGLRRGPELAPRPRPRSR